MEEAPEMASLFMVGAAFPEGPQLPQASWSWARFRWCQGRQGLVRLAGDLLSPSLLPAEAGQVGLS